MGIVINSNYSRGYGVVSYNDADRYLTYDISVKKLFKAMYLRFILRARRLLLRVANKNKLLT